MVVMLAICYVSLVAGGVLSLNSSLAQDNQSSLVPSDSDNSSATPTVLFEEIIIRNATDGDGGNATGVVSLRSGTSFRAALLQKPTRGYDEEDGHLPPTYDVFIEVLKNTSIAKILYVYLVQWVEGMSREEVLEMNPNLPNDLFEKVREEYGLDNNSSLKNLLLRVTREDHGTEETFDLGKLTSQMTRLELKKFINILRPTRTDSNNDPNSSTNAPTYNFNFLHIGKRR